MKAKIHYLIKCQHFTKSTLSQNLIKSLKL